MKEFLNFFSLAPVGDVPVGLTCIRQTQKLNQPSFKEQQQFNFVPLFNQIQNFFFEEVEEESVTTTTENELIWLNTIKNHK